jgi:hypothetical protein
LKSGVLEFLFIYNILIPAKEVISVFQLLPEELTEGSELVVSTAQQPVAQVTKDKEASHIW